MVINPEAGKDSARLGRNVNRRVPGRDSASLVSNHPRVTELVKKLVGEQGEVLINMFQTIPEMTLGLLPGARIIGPDAQLANRWNSKIHTYRSMDGVVPIPEFRVCFNRDELIQTTRELWSKWLHGIFLSLEYSAAGAFSFRSRSEGELLDRLGDWRPPYLITRFIPHLYDPTVLAVVANENDVYVAGIADQQMADVNKFTGSLFPSVLPPDLLDKLKGLTATVGRALGRTGYRGIFGCDYIVDDGGDPFFVEVNARKQGTTMEMCCHLENSLPEGCANLLELELLAVTDGKFPENTRELPVNPGNVHWGTYNFKVERDVIVGKALPSPPDERALFREAHRSHGAEARHIVVEHVGADFVVGKGSFLGRVVSIGNCREDVVKGLEQGKNTLAQTLEKESENGVRATTAQSAG